MKRTGNRFLIAILILLFLFTLSGCNNNDIHQEEKIIVVTSIFPLADLAQKIGGEKIEAVSLLKGNASPHDYEPTPDDIKLLSGGDLLIFIGQGLDQFAIELAKAQDDKKVLVLADRIKEQAPQLLLQQNGVYDPHIWTDPILVRDEIAPLIATQLCEIDLANKDYYEQNLKEVQEELTELDTQIKQTVQAFSRKSFLTTHAAWGYFAKRYGLEEISIEKFSGQEPSPKELMQVIDYARQKGIKTVFAEAQTSSKTAEIIAEELGGQVMNLDALGNPAIAEKSNYFDLLLWNVAQLERGLE